MKCLIRLTTFLIVLLIIQIISPSVYAREQVAAVQQQQLLQKFVDDFNQKFAARLKDLDKILNTNVSRIDEKATAQFARINTYLLDNTKSMDTMLSSNLVKSKTLLLESLESIDAMLNKQIEQLKIDTDSKITDIDNRAHSLLGETNAQLWTSSQKILYLIVFAALLIITALSTSLLMVKKNIRFDSLAAITEASVHFIGMIAIHAVLLVVILLLLSVGFNLIPSFT